MKIDRGLPLETQLGLSEFEIVPINPTSDENLEVPYKEANFNTHEVENLCRNSLDFLAATALPTVFKYNFPPVFQQIWVWLLSYVAKTRDFSQLAIGLPRGFGKTMLIKIFILYCILFTKKTFILIICGTQAKANNIIADVIGMLDESNIRKIFGSWNIGATTDRQDLKNFGFRGRNIILMGAGAESDIRGITLLNARPDVMIFDDIQTKEDAESDTISNKLETWMLSTAMKAKSPEGCLFIFIANMYPTKWSLLRKLKKNPNWIKFIAGGILADGTSLWEDLQPIEQLLREFQNDLSAGHPEIFYSEVLNDENASVNKHIDISKIPENKFEGETLHQGNFVIIDPATDKTNADAVSIGYFEMFDAIPVATEIIDERLSPGDIAEKAIKLCLQRNCRVIVVEANAFQYVLCWIINQTLQKYGIIGIHVVDIYSGGTSKNSRILTMFKQLLAGEILLAQEVRPLVFNQIIPFNPLKTNNTDGILDLLCYSARVPEMYGEFITSMLTIEMQEFDAIPVRTEAENCPF